MNNGPDWFPLCDWAGQTVVIVASGPSAKDQPLETARGVCRFIAVNSSWALCPWADMLYACDYRWWRYSDGWKDFQGLRVCLDPHACNKDVHPDWNVNLIRCEKNTDDLLIPGHPKYRPGMIGWASNSGFGAVNIAAQRGVKSIILVGFDLNLALGSHWHGAHSGKLGNPREASINRWKRALERAAPKLAEAGIAVFNTSPHSRLKAFEKLDFATALAKSLAHERDSV